MKIRAVLFDAHGVLIEAAEPVGETYARILARYGVTLPAWRIQDGLRRTLQQAPAIPSGQETSLDMAELERLWWKERVRETLQSVDSTLLLQEFSALFESLFDHFAEAKSWSLCPSARETLQRLRQNRYKTGVVSNFDHRLIRILEGLGIAELLDITAIPSLSGFAKPDPRAFRHALNALDVSADETLFVGHDPALDEAAARAAGLFPLSVEGKQNLSSLPTRIKEIATLPVHP